MDFGTDFQNYATKHRNINSMVMNDFKNSMTPYIMEERQLNVAQVDVFSRMMAERIIFLGTGVNDQVANIIIAQLLYLESVSKDPIKLYINSPGGSVYAGLGIYDTMQLVVSEVHTVCTGLAASMGAVLLAAGEAGKRHALRHSRIMIHQPSGGADGQASDILIVAKEIQNLKLELYEILADHTGKTVEEIERDSDRDYWMKSNEAKEYGLIDSIHKKKKA